MMAPLLGGVGSTVARRKHPDVAAATQDMILPFHLVERPTPARDSEWDRERCRWFADRGINLADFHSVRAVNIASDRFHGIPNNALDRAWVRSVGLDEWRRIHQAG